MVGPMPLFKSLTLRTEERPFLVSIYSEGIINSNSTKL
jgi:hypothetical protein